MTRCPRLLHHVLHVAGTLLTLLGDVMRFLRLLGTLRRECLDFVIPLTENHVRRRLAAWIPHYNHGRPAVLALRMFSSRNK